MKKRAWTDEVISFCGWDFLKKTIEKSKTQVERGLISALFETGGRVSEVLELSANNFHLNLSDEFIVVKTMPVEKQYKKVGEYEGEEGNTRWETEKVRDYRSFPIKKDEPLADYLTSLVRNKNEKLFPFDRARAYRIVKRICNRLEGEEIPGTREKGSGNSLYAEQITPHFFRAERASQLAEEYGFEEMTLRQFFGWKEEREKDMAQKYASMGWKGLARKMNKEIEEI